MQIIDGNIIIESSSHQLELRGTSIYGCVSWTSIIRNIRHTYMQFCSYFTVALHEASQERWPRVWFAVRAVWSLDGSEELKVTVIDWCREPVGVDCCLSICQPSMYPTLVQAIRLAQAPPQHC